MTRTAKKSLAALTTAFAGEVFYFNFSAEIAHSGSGDKTVFVSRKVFTALALAGAVQVSNLIEYKIAV